jgi:6-phosphogluconolactonase (cycloisomerase 2 family)
MRMTFNKSSQLALVSAAGLLAATLLTACAQLTQTLTVDFVYVASSKAAGSNNYGEIDVFEINSESGRMRQIPSSPFPSGGRNPVAEAVSSDYSSLFVANHDDNTIVQFVIGSDGKLYPFYTVNTPGIYPMALAASKSNLFVVDTYEPLPVCSTANPCSGAIAVYPLTAVSGSTPVGMGTPAANGIENYWPLCKSGYKQSTGGGFSTWVCNATESDIIVPTATSFVTSGSNAYVYVTAYDSTVSPSAGYVFGFSVGSGGALTPLAGSPFAAGVHPSAIASDSTGAYVYVTDFAKYQVLGYAVSSGSLTPLAGSPFATGSQPVAIVVDPVYPFAYVANMLDSTVTAYTISNGALTAVGSYPTGTQPVAIGIDPSTEHFLFTANFLSSNVSGFELSTSGGTLLISQYSPYAASAQPVAVAAIPHNGTGAGIQK